MFSAENLRAREDVDLKATGIAHEIAVTVQVTPSVLAPVAQQEAVARFQSRISSSGWH
jgi:hypothetical protein